MDSNLSLRFSRTLVQGARTKPCDVFQNWALNEFRQLVAFDAAIWFSASIQSNKISVHHTHTYNASNSISDQLEELFKLHNPAKIKATETNEFAVNLLNSPFIDQHKHFFQSCTELLELNHALLAGYCEGQPGLMFGLILYRAGQQSVFTTREKTISKFSVGLMQEMKHFNLWYRFSTNTHNPCIAICDQRGFIRDISPDFLSLLKEEYPEWESPCLDFIPQHLFYQQETTTYAGKNIFIRLNRIGAFIALQTEQENNLKILTHAEKKVAHYLTLGLTNKEIARQLNISPKTVSNHLHHIFGKISARNRQHAVHLITNNVPI